MARGRSTDARMPTQSELGSTLIVRFPIDEGSAQVRSGGPKDEDEDLARPIGAGQIPFELMAGPLSPKAGCRTARWSRPTRPTTRLADGRPGEPTN